MMKIDDDKHAFILRGVREHTLSALDLVDEILRDPWNKAYGSDFATMERYLRGLGEKLEDCVHIVDHLSEGVAGDG